MAEQKRKPNPPIKCDLCGRELEDREIIVRHKLSTILVDVEVIGQTEVNDLRTLTTVCTDCESRGIALVRLMQDTQLLREVAFKRGIDPLTVLEELVEEAVKRAKPVMLEGIDEELKHMWALINGVDIY